MRGWREESSDPLDPIRMRNNFHLGWRIVGSFIKTKQNKNNQQNTTSFLVSVHEMNILKNKKNKKNKTKQDLAVNSFVIKGCRNI